MAPKKMDLYFTHARIGCLVNYRENPVAAHAAFCFPRPFRRTWVCLTYLKLQLRSMGSRSCTSDPSVWLFEGAGFPVIPFNLAPWIHSLSLNQRLSNDCRHSDRNELWERQQNSMPIPIIMVEGPEARGPVVQSHLQHALAASFGSALN